MLVKRWKLLGSVEISGWIVGWLSEMIPDLASDINEGSAAENSENL